MLVSPSIPASIVSGLVILLGFTHPLHAEKKTLDDAAESVPPVCLISVRWSSGDTLYPAVKTSRPGWFLTVAPSALGSVESEQPLLIAGESQTVSKIKHLNPAHRLCLLEADTAFAPPAQCNLSRTLVPPPGMRLISYSQEDTCASMVVGKDWTYQGERLPSPLIRIRMSEHGSCQPGTPLVNQQGEIEGILADRTLATQGEVHAIPALQIRKLLSDMERFQRTGRVWLGMVFHNETSTPEILEVKEKSPAAEAGIQKGDIVIALNDSLIDDLLDMVEASYHLPAGEEASIKVLRGMSEQEFRIVPAFSEAPAEAETATP